MITLIMLDVHFHSIVVLLRCGCCFFFENPEEEEEEPEKEHLLLLKDDNISMFFFMRLGVDRHAEPVDVALHREHDLAGDHRDERREAEDVVAVPRLDVNIQLRPGGVGPHSHVDVERDLCIDQTVSRVR